MIKIYFYPKIILKESDTQNSYARDLELAIAAHHEVVNKVENSKGVLDFFKYLSKADVYLFSWIEDIPRRKHGKLQVVFFTCFILLRRLFGAKIIWVLHNKYSHNMAKNRWTDYMFKTMMKNADLILTHSNEGIEFVKSNYPKYADKVKYEIHPIKEKLTNKVTEKKFDFFFWGTIHPYKNVTEFLKFIKKQGEISSKKILIVGFCADENYRNELISLLDNNITFENKFYEMDEIANFAAQSKFTLFTYSADSVLSSGALMDTIRMNTEIIGPNHGAFKDLASLPILHVYETYEDILKIFENSNLNEHSDNQQINRFFIENSWVSFADKLRKHTAKLF